MDIVPPGCLNQTADWIVCPYQGFDNIMDWVDMQHSQLLQPNVSLKDFSAIRYLTSSANGDHISGWTATSSVSIRDARDLGDYWDYALAWGLDIVSIYRPTLIPFLVSGPGLQQPLVQVQCTAYYDVPTLREIEFPHKGLNSWPLQTYQNATWVLPVDFSASVRDSSSQNPLFNETFSRYNIQDEIFFEWVDMTNFSDGLTLGALSVFWTGNGSTAVVPCTIDAHWAPVSIFLDPTNGGIIYQDSPDPGLLLSDAGSDANSSTTTMTRISIDKAWAATMDYPYNGTNGNSTLYSTAIRALISGFGGDYKGDYQIVGEGTPGTPQSQDTIPWRISTVLGMYLTEALASIQLNATLVYHDYPNDTYVLNMDDIGGGHWNYSVSPNASFEDYAAAQGFTKVQIRVQRYGYGWRFQGVPIKLAATVLALHSLMAIVHTVLIFAGGWTCASWTSMGQMLVLALSSLPPTMLTNTSAGVKHMTTWGRICAVKEAYKHGRTHLHLVLRGDEDLRDGDEATRPKKSTKYA